MHKVFCRNSIRALCLKKIANNATASSMALRHRARRPVEAGLRALGQADRGDVAGDREFAHLGVELDPDLPVDNAALPPGAVDYHSRHAVVAPEVVWEPRCKQRGEEESV